MHSKKLIAGLAAGAALALPLVFASPAAAATLPAGDGLWAISCDYDSEAQQGFAALYSVNPANAQGTMVGDNGTTIPNDCGAQPAYNPTTGESYYISWNSQYELAKIDVTTGVGTVIGEIIAPGFGDHPASIAIGLDGKAYLWDDDSNFYSLDLATGTPTLITPTELESIYSFSVDPTTGQFYAIEEDGDSYRIDVTTGGATFLGRIVDENSAELEIYSLQIDTAGSWWIINVVGPGDDTEIRNGAQPAAPEVSFASVGFFDDIENEFLPFTEALLITYPPRLAATGAEQGVLLATGAAGAVVLMLAGAAFVASRRRSA